MIPEDLIFWMDALTGVDDADVNVLCARHADAMVVPRGWTLDDRREAALRLFKPRPGGEVASRPRTRRPRPSREPGDNVQLQIDGTGEIERPPTHAIDGAEVVDGPAAIDEAGEAPAVPWQPDFDADDDLDGLLEVSSPLLARAFRGTGRRRE
jgi:hypothetical protein